MKKQVVLDVAGGPVPAIGSRLVPWSLLHAKRTQRNWLLGTLGRLQQVFLTADLCRGLWCAKGPHPWLLKGASDVWMVGLNCRYFCNQDVVYHL